MSTPTRVLWGLVAGALCLPLQAQDCSFRELGAEETKTASFVAGDCRLRDLDSSSRSNALAHPYSVTLERDGILTVDLKSAALDTYLYVYTLGFTRLRDNDNLSASTTDSRVVLSLRRGTYVVVASTRGVSTGSYTLQTALAALPKCPETELRLDSPIDGALTAESCRYMDFTAPAADLSRVAAYRLTVPSPMVLTARMTGQGFSPYLELLDSNYDGLVGADAEGDPEIELEMSLEPGSYVLLATTSEVGATGAFTLTAALAEPRSCPARDLGLSETVRGRLVYGEDCRYLDLEPLSYDTTPVQLHRIVVGKRGVLSLNLSSTAFTPFLAVFDEQGIGIADTSGDEEPGPTAQLLASLIPGTYFVLVNTWDDDGPYTLTVEFSEPRACDTADVRLGESMPATLTADGCRVLDVVAPSGDSYYAAGFRLTVSSYAVLTADQTSTQMDPYLLLYADEARLLAVNDNGGGGRDARLISLVAPGTYFLLASTADSAAGVSTLNAQLAPPPACPVTPLETAATVSGELSATDCRLREVVVGSSGTSYAKSYRLMLADAGQLRMELASRTMATALVLADAEGKPLKVFQAGPESITRLSRRLAAGTYLVQVTATGATRTGAFTLQSSFEPGQ